MQNTGTMKEARNYFWIQVLPAFIQNKYNYSRPKQKGMYTFFVLAITSVIYVSICCSSAYSTTISTALEITSYNDQKHAALFSQSEDRKNHVQNQSHSIKCLFKQK